jgi:hypothetical protein
MRRRTPWRASSMPKASCQGRANRSRRGSSPAYAARTASKAAMNASGSGDS